MLSVKSPVMVFSCLKPESKLGWKQLMRNIPSIDLFRYFPFIILLFLSQWVLLSQCRDNPFIFLRLPNPNWITCINSRVLAPAASMSPGCVGQPESWGRLRLFIFTWSSMCRIDFYFLYTQPSQNPFAPGLWRTNTSYSEFSFVVKRRPVLSA